MYIIVVGCGRVGAAFANILSDEGHDVVIIDNKPNNFSSLDEDFKGLTLIGEHIDQEILKQAGIENCDALAAVVQDDNINIMVCQMAKEIFNVPKVLARIYNPEREHVFHEFGLKTICPTRITVGVVKSIILDNNEPKPFMFGNDTVLFRYKKYISDKEEEELINYKVDENEYIFGVLREQHLIFLNENPKLIKGDQIVIAQNIDR